MLIGFYAKLIIGAHFYWYVILRFFTSQLKGFNLKTYNTKRNLIIHKCILCSKGIRGLC